MLRNEPIISFNAAEAISAGARVKFSSGTNTIVNAVLADVEIGTAILYSGKSSYAIGDAVGVKLNNAPGTRTVIANGAIAVGAVVKRAAAGKVAPASGTGANYAIAMEAAGADGDLIEVLHVDGL